MMESPDPLRRRRQREAPLAKLLCTNGRILLVGCLCVEVEPFKPFGVGGRSQLFCDGFYQYSQGGGERCFQVC